jgi:outer membrane receptor for ferrienterochelin and colicin
LFDVFGARSRACERILADTARQVPGVISAEAECRLQFGGSWQRQTLKLSAATEDEAYPIVEQVLKALAQVRAVEDNWSTPQIYELTSGDTLHSLEAIGFNGSPTVGAVRSHYGIQPAR